MRRGDLAFVDPPYSGVHYSRFYHVLEAIAVGKCENVTGAGRYPAPEFRPKSDFSLRTKSVAALSSLFQKISERQAHAIVTFPDHECSNGLSGDSVVEIARRYFHIHVKSVASSMSSLGGNSGESGAGKERAARRQARELILRLKP
jgi:adenine-specific DNA methylase